MTPRNRSGEVIADAPPGRIRDFEIIARRGAPIRSERLRVDPETRGVCNALVYLSKPTAIHDEVRKAVPRTLRFRADRGVFDPHVLATMTGTEIQVTTDDPVVYNLDIRFPGAEMRVTMDDPRPGEARTRSHNDQLNYVFGDGQDRRGGPLKVQPQAGSLTPMPVLENMHVWMSGWWLVLDHPYFAVTDDRGNFEIREVPSGPQEVIVWHESIDPRSQRSGATPKPRYIFQGEVDFPKDQVTEKAFVIESTRVLSQ